MEITRVRELNLGLACPYLPPSAALEELSRVYFEKTELGCVEVVRRIADLPARLRRLLILVDGRRSVAELAQFVATGGIVDAMRELELRGFITPLLTVAESRPRVRRHSLVGANPQRLLEVKARITGCLAEALGADARRFIAAIEAVATPQALLEVLQQLEPGLGKFVGRSTARELTRRTARELGHVM